METVFSIKRSQYCRVPTLQCTVHCVQALSIEGIVFIDRNIFVRRFLLCMCLRNVRHVPRNGNTDWKKQWSCGATCRRKPNCWRTGFPLQNMRWMLYLMITAQLSSQYVYHISLARCVLFGLKWLNFHFLTVVFRSGMFFSGKTLMHYAIVYIITFTWCCIIPHHLFWMESNWISSKTRKILSVRN